MNGPAPFLFLVMLCAPPILGGCKRVIEDCKASIQWLPDADGDGWGDQAGETYGCTDPPTGFVSPRTGGSDCDDADPAIYPGADEISDSLDNDCDGESDEGLDSRSTRVANDPDTIDTGSDTSSEPIDLG